MKKNRSYKDKYIKMRNDFFGLAQKYIDGSDSDYKDMYNNLLKDYIDINTKYVELYNKILILRK